MFHTNVEGFIVDIVDSLVHVLYVPYVLVTDTDGRDKRLICHAVGMRTAQKNTMKVGFCGLFV